MNTLNDNTRNKLNVPINYSSSSGPVTCHYVNANSDNCRNMGELAGCQAYCIPNGKSHDKGFLIEERCPSNTNSCERSQLVWNYKEMS